MKGTSIKKMILGVSSLTLIATSNIASVNMIYANVMHQEQTQEQTADQNVTVSDIRIKRTGLLIEDGSEDHYLLPGYYMELLADVRLNDKSSATEKMADVTWQIKTESGDPVHAYVKENHPLTREEAEKELDHRGVTNKSTRKTLLKTLTRSTISIYAPCGYQNVEELKLTAISVKDPRVKSKPYALHIVKKQNGIEGKESYFQFSLGKGVKGTISEEKEIWDNEKFTYTIKTPKAMSKSKWFQFIGWKDLENGSKLYKAGVQVEDTPMVYGGQKNMEAVWKDLRVREVQHVQYRLNDTKEIVYAQKTAEKTKKYIRIPEYVTYNKKKYPVTIIDTKAFANTKLKGIELGKNIRSIGNEAFAESKEMEIIEIKSQCIKKVGKNAFKNLRANVTITCPKKCEKEYRRLFRKAGLCKEAVVKGI